MKITIGADPELFLADAAGGLVAVCDKIGGTKDHPMPLPLGDGFAVQEDNVAVEFNIPPSASADELHSNLDRAMEFLATFFKNQHGLSFINLSAASFPQEQLEHWKTKIFGCEPDFNAWTGKQNPRPSASDPNLRSAGGHVHVGFDAKDDHDRRNLIKCMDLCLAVPAVMMDEGELRKQLYGKAGAMRFKPYGAEYRVLSNFWVFNKAHREWVWNSTAQAVDVLHNHIDDVEEDAELIIGAIDGNDKGIADFLINKYDLNVVYA